MDSSKSLGLAVFLCALIGSFCGLTHAQYGGGSGDPNNPYLIYTAEQLNEIGLHEDHWDKHFKLMADLDLAAYTGAEVNLIGSPLEDGSGGSGAGFKGVFDGGCHTIANFAYSSANEAWVGLFRCVDDPNAVVKNLSLIDPNIDIAGGYAVGALVGQLQEGIVTNCYAEGGAVSADESVGGLVGHGGRCAIVNCYASSMVTANNNVGGLVGGSQGRITNCYAACKVDGVAHVGGLLGYSAPSRRLGLPAEPEIVASFWDIEASGQARSGGGQGKTTAQMQMTITFMSWGTTDNEGIWTIDESNDYPRLWWENQPGVPIVFKPLSELLAGEGSQDDPYRIQTAGQLYCVGLFPGQWDKYFELSADVDLSAYTGTEFTIIGDGKTPFSGVFDGNGHVIANFTYNGADKDFTGLFGYAWSVSAEIKNLGLIDPNVDAGAGGEYAGSLVGCLCAGTVANCYVEGAAVSAYRRVGGVVGYSEGGVIVDCYSSGRVFGDEYIGGLVGCNAEGGEIVECHSTADVFGNMRVGGLVGWNYPKGSYVVSCSAAGTVAGGHIAGGLVGKNGGAVSSSRSTGPVSGADCVGGLVGHNWFGNVAMSYAAGAVSGDSHVGGLVGLNLSGSIIGSFWDVETSGQAESSGGTGLPTAQMQTAATFLAAGWDFVGETENGTEDIWWILEGRDYPRLSWELGEAESP
ncbi:MAG: hypothetical protein JW741_20080 [Sedimentisphaerales bacterium]|nr:hypothetical protein [Sedimentisphaerales bacterium]